VQCCQCAGQRNYHAVCLPCLSSSRTHPDHAAMRSIASTSCVMSSLGVGTLVLGGYCLLQQQHSCLTPHRAPQNPNPKYTRARGANFCKAIRRYIAKCRARFGVHVLRCHLSAGRATACNSKKYRLVDPASHNACGAPLYLQRPSRSLAA